MNQEVQRHGSLTPCEVVEHIARLGIVADVAPGRFVDGFNVAAECHRTSE